MSELICERCGAPEDHEIRRRFMVAECDEHFYGDTDTMALRSPREAAAMSPPLLCAKCAQDSE